MRILVATDMSEAADVALREGAAMAASPNDVLAVVHVVPKLVHESLFFPPRDSTIEARTKELVARATAALHARVAMLAPRATDVFVDDGMDYAEIVRRAEAWRADVIVVGNHGHWGIARLIGDVATKVARHAPCNVLIARKHDARGVVIAATDGSNPSLPAVSAGAVEARRRNAKLEVVHAVGFLSAEAMYLAVQGSPSLRAAPDSERAGEALGDAIKKLGVEAKCEMLDGSAASAILRYATSAGAELVVVGAHGNTNLARAGLGTVAQKIVRACPCSVLVVREQRT